MGGRGSASAKAGGKNLTMKDIKKNVPGDNINLGVPKLRSMMDKAKVGTTFEFQTNPSGSEAREIFKKTSEKEWTFIFSTTDKSGKEHTWSKPLGREGAEELWNHIYVY